MKKILVLFIVIIVVFVGVAVFIGPRLAHNFIANKFSDIVSKGNIQVNKNGKDMTINGVTIKQGVPDNFPKDFPMMPKIEITSSMGKGNTSTTTASIPAPMDEVYAYYLKNLGDKGWEIKESTFGELKMIELKKGSLTGNVAFTKEASKTNLLISFKEK